MIRRVSFLLLPLLFASAVTVHAGTSSSPITSAEITARTLAALPSCLHYQIKGVCFWNLDGVITTTPYLQHYLPDVVVSVFNKPDENPWLALKNTSAFV